MLFVKKFGKIFSSVCCLTFTLRELNIRPRQFSGLYIEPENLMIRHLTLLTEILGVSAGNLGICCFGPFSGCKANTLDGLCKIFYTNIQNFIINQ